MPRKKKESKLESPPIILIEERGIDEILQKDPTELTAWEKFKLVMKLSEEETLGTIAEKMGIKRGTIQQMLRIKREKLIERGIDPDKLYMLFEEGLSPWRILPYLDTEGFPDIVDKARDLGHFEDLFKEWKETSTSLTGYRVSLKQLLQIVLEGDPEPVLKKRNPPVIGKTFRLRLPPIEARLELDEDRRVRIVILTDENDDGSSGIDEEEE